MSEFKKFYGNGFEGAFTERDIACDSWNAAVVNTLEYIKDKYGLGDIIEREVKIAMMEDE